MKTPKETHKRRRDAGGLTLYTSTVISALVFIIFSLSVLLTLEFAEPILSLFSQP